MKISANNNLNKDREILRSQKTVSLSFSKQIERKTKSILRVVIFRMNLVKVLQNLIR